MFCVDKIKYEQLAILSNLKSCQFAPRIVIFNLRLYFGYFQKWFTYLLNRSVFGKPLFNNQTYFIIKQVDWLEQRHQVCKYLHTCTCRSRNGYIVLIFMHYIPSLSLKMWPNTEDLHVYMYVDLVMFIKFFLMFLSVLAIFLNQNGFLKPKIKTGFDFIRSVSVQLKTLKP